MHIPSRPSEEDRRGPSVIKKSSYISALRSPISSITNAKALEAEDFINKKRDQILKKKKEMHVDLNNDN